MKRLLLVLVFVPVALASAGDPVKSRWRSLVSGNLFEVTDYGDRVSVRFLESEVVADQDTERPDVTVSLNGPRQQVRPGRWLLEKRGDGTYVGTTSQRFNCNYRNRIAEWKTHVCQLSDAVEMSMTADLITGQIEQPVTKASFDCGKCKWSKMEKTDFKWARENSGQQTAVPTAAATPGATGSDGGAAQGAHGVFTIQSTPSSAEVYVDGEFVGSTPIEHGLPAGKHEIEVRKKGFSRWKRQLSVSPGARATVAAELEP